MGRRRRIGWLRALRIRWLRLRWGILSLAGLLAVALGWWGFALSFADQGQPGSGLDNLYRALGLFTLEGGDVPAPVPWPLQVARFLAPLTVFAAAVGATMSVFHGEVQRFRAHWLVRDHVIIVGLGGRGLPLARQLVTTGQRCVLVDVLGLATRSTGARLLGIPVVTANEVDTELMEPGQLGDLLLRAGLPRAEVVVVMTGSPALNVRFAYALHRLLAEDRAARRVLVEMDDADTLRNASGHAPYVARRSVEWFSLADRAARSLLDELDGLGSLVGIDPVDHVDEPGATPTSPGATGLTDPTGPPARRAQPERHHLVVVGRTLVGRSLLVQAARNWSSDLSPSNGDRLVLTMVEPSTGRGTATGVPLDQEAYLLHRRDPRLPLDRSGQAQLIVATWDVTRHGLTDLLVEIGAGPPDAVIVTADGDDELLRLSLDVTAELADDVPVWLCAEQSGGLVDIVPGYDGHSTGRPVNVFHAVDTVLSDDGIVRGVDDELARSLHLAHRAGHMRTRADPADPDDPDDPDDPEAMLPWHQLPTDLRALNHAAVAAWRRVLVDDGFRLIPYREVGAETVALPDDLVERLADAMHAAWNTEKKRQGYRSGMLRNRDPGRGSLIHPNIDVPFGSLPVDDVEWNLLQARAIPKHLAAAGLQLDPAPGDQPTS